MANGEVRLGGALHASTAIGYGVVIAVHGALLGLLGLAGATGSLPFDLGLAELAAYGALTLLFGVEVHDAWTLWRCVRCVRRERDGSWTLRGFFGLALGAVGAGVPRTVRVLPVRRRFAWRTAYAPRIGRVCIEFEGRRFSAPANGAKEVQRLADQLVAMI